MRPISHACHIPVPHGVEVNIIDMAGEIDLIADRMFPIPALPYATLFFRSRLFEIRSPLGRARENEDLINRQRVAKSASPSGNVQIACR